MERIQVLIAEDEVAVREALVDLVGSDPALSVAGTAPDADQAIDVATATQPDVALVDVRMPGGGGPRAAREIRNHSPQTRIVALSAYEDRSTVLEMLRAGAVGYIVKGTSADEILGTIHRAAKGQGSLSTEVTAEVIQELVILLERSEEMASELRTLDETKREIIQILSHELFTPITAIQGFAATLAAHGDDLSREELQTMASGVARAGTRIKRLVGNLAASARLDREGVELPTGPIGIPGLVDAALDEFAEDRGRIVVDAAREDVAVWADLALATRALVILIENALALSQADVEISYEALGDNVEIRVADRGPGIPDDLRARLFTPFTQADTSTTRGHQGMGIGLFLARRIMIAHSGGVDAQAREGGGSIFRLTFPRSKVGVG